MNSSFTRRLLVGGDLPEWKVRVVDYIGLGMLLVCTEELWHRPQVWYSWVGALAIGIAFLWAGETIPHAWKRVRELWPWHQLRIARTELAQMVQEKKLASLPLPSQGRLADKPQHNVQFIGFKIIHDEPFRFASLQFQNAPDAGKLLGKFNHPRLRVIYYEHPTGQEIDDFYSVAWHEEDKEIQDISAAGRSAQIAWFFDRWKALEGNERRLTSLSFIDEDERPYESRCIELPSGKIRIVAILYGNYVDTPVLTVNGILTLEADGSASFSKDA